MDPASHAAMILLQPIVLVSAGSVLDVPAQRRPDRARIRAVSVRGDVVRGQTGGRLRGTEECPRCRHVAMLREHSVDQGAIAVLARDLMEPGKLRRGPARGVHRQLLDPPRPGDAPRPELRDDTGCPLKPTKPRRRSGRPISHSGPPPYYEACCCACKARRNVAR